MQLFRTAQKQMQSDWSISAVSCIDSLFFSFFFFFFFFFNGDVLTWWVNDTWGGFAAFCLYSSMLPRYVCVNDKVQSYGGPPMFKDIVAATLHCSKACITSI